MNIYTGNLAYSVSDADLRDAFEAYGKVSSASVIMDRTTGQSKGFGFVEMANNSEADAAIKALSVAVRYSRIKAEFSGAKEPVGR